MTKLIPPFSAGTNVDTGQPVEVPYEQLTHHSLMRGITGCGKSMLMLLMCQYLIRLMAKGISHCLFIIDISPTDILRNGLKAECDHQGVVLREFTLETPLTHLNPLECFGEWRNNPAVSGGFAAAGLSVDYGPGYGRSHFAAQAVFLITKAFEILQHSGEEVTLSKLAETVVSLNKKLRQPSEIGYLMAMLPHFLQLNGESKLGQFSIAQTIDERQVALLRIDSLLFPSMSRLVAGLILPNIIAAQQRRKRERKRPTRSFVFFDEFSQVAARHTYGRYLTTVRKHLISLNLLYQSTAQLDADNLTDIVTDNCRNHFLFSSSTDGDVESLRNMSEEVIRPLTGTSGAGATATFNFRDIVDRSLDTNDVMDASDSAAQYYLVQRNGQGHEDPVRIHAPLIAPKLLVDWDHPPEWLNATIEPSLPVGSGDPMGLFAETSQELNAKLQSFYDNRIAEETHRM